MAWQRKTPFGYMVQNGETIPCPAEADAVQGIFTRYLAGASYGRIAEEMSRGNVPYLNVVINPGKENSEEQAFQVDKSTEVEFDAMEGYQLYYDYDCTQPMDWIDVGQNKLTVYIQIDIAK